MEYATAKALLAEAVKADPFGMEDFRKFGFWANLAVISKTDSMTKVAYNKMIQLEDSAKLDIFNDITDVTPTIYHAAQEAFTRVINK